LLAAPLRIAAMEEWLVDPVLIEAVYVES